MMGKDYTLAIIIVNYDDNLWTDQNLQLDPDLPSGWRTITDSTGTYYWHVPTGATQWHHPRRTTTGPQEETSCKPEVHQNRASWNEEDVTNHDPDSKVFSVRSLGWLQVEEEDLGPGRSSLAVSNVIQQLALSRTGTPGPVQDRGRDRGQERGQDRGRDWDQDQGQAQGQEPPEPLEACGEGREMKLVLKKDSLILLDPLNHTPLHCQPIGNIRVWGVGCNHGRSANRSRASLTNQAV